MKIGKIIKTAAILLVVLLIAGVLFMFYIRKKRESYIIDGPGMINTREGEIEAVSYSCYGGMEGNSISYKLTRLENGCSQFEYEIISVAGDESFVGTVDLDYDAFVPIRQVCRNSGLLLYYHMGTPMEEIPLDEPEKTVTFTLYGEEYIDFYGNYVYPKKFSNVINDICHELEKFLPQDAADKVD